MSTSTSRPGDRPGYSDLVIEWQQQKPVRVTETLDNNGSESTGVYQSSVTINYDPYWAWNDLFYLSYTQSIVFDVDDRGSQGISGHYSIPYGYWLLSVNAGYNETFQTISGTTSSYVYGGENSNQSVKVERSLYRNSRNKVSSYLSLQMRQSANYINDVEIRIQRRRSSTLEWALNHQLFRGRATLNSGLSYKVGLQAFGAIEDPEVASGEGVENPQWVTLNTGYRQPFQWLGQNWTVDTQVKTQVNFTPLIPRDQFSIGSAYTVRGFDGAVSAESGAYWRNDLSMAVPVTAQQVTLGLDAGTLFDEGESLVGGSLGVRGSLFGVTYDASASLPIYRSDDREINQTLYSFQLTKSF